MKEFFARIGRYLLGTTKRFLREAPQNPYEALIFRIIRETATIYSRRVILL